MKLNHSSFRKLLQTSGRFFAQFSIFFTITVFLWISVEGAARLMVLKIKWTPSPYMLKYTDKRLSTLYETDDPELYREVLKEGWGRAIDIYYSPFVEYASIPTKGKHVNIHEAGFRVPKSGATNLSSPNKKIFVFGGSTTFGLGVPDEETIPAYLQKSFRAVGRKDIDVFNFGTVGYYSTQERIQFEKLINLGHIPDIAIFINGLNDSLFCDTPDTTGVSRRLEKAWSEGGGRTLADTYAKRSSIIKMIQYFSQGTPIARDRPGVNCTAENKQIKSMVHRLDTNRRMIYGIGKEFGIRTVFVHQPLRFYLSDTNFRSVDKRWEYNVKLTIRRFYENIVAQRDKGLAFDNDVLWLELERSNHNMYIDDVHYTPKFNKHLAERIYKYIVDRI